MEEFIPYLLILISWHPDEPGKFLVERAPKAYVTAELCEADGSEYIAQREIYRAEFGGRHFAYKCLPSASGKEIDQAWDEWKDVNQ